MILNKALLLKCLGGVAACTGVAGVGIFGSQMGTGGTSSGDTPENPPAAVTTIDLSTLIAKVGLTTCTTPNQDCSIGETGLKVKQGDNKEDSKTKDTTSSTGSPAGKIKVYSDSSYENKFKFVIEEGNINFGSSGTVTKLEQFETYEIKEETEGTDKKWYFSRKTEAKDEIKKALGLPEGCTLPEESSTSGATCTISTTNIGKIKFDGENSNPSSTGDITLTITKLTTPEEDFPFDYKFSFKGKDTNANLTINSKQITLKSSEGTEFKIKKGTSGNSLTLEEAWSLNRLLEKVGLSGCTTAGNGTECSISSLKVKHESGNGEENKTKDTTDGGSSGKIKVYKENTSTTYSKGFKFVIEEGDIKLTGGSGSTTISKLEEFETYEIKKDSDKWYLTRKTKAEEGIKKALGLDGIENCNFPTGESNTSTCCELNAEKLKKINFDGKGTSDPTIDNSGTAKLTITKVSDDSKSDFPFGYKFAFESTQDITISSAAPTKSIKKNTNTEFKIKKDNKNLTLEKAWTVTTLAQKVGLTCSENNGNKECTLPTDNSLKLYNSDSDNTTSGKATDTTKKLKYEEDQEGYNQGFKFYTDDDIDLGDSKKIEKKGDDSSAVYYEIKQQTVSGSSNWYLSKHTTASK